MKPDTKSSIVAFHLAVAITEYNNFLHDSRRESNILIHGNLVPIHGLSRMSICRLLSFSDLDYDTKVLLKKELDFRDFNIQEKRMQLYQLTQL